MVACEDREYVTRVISGDARAFEALVRKYNRLGGAIAFAVLGDLGLAEDVVQDAFLRAYRAIGSLRDPARFRQWFAGIVRKRAIDVRRQRRDSVPVAEVEETGSRDAGPEERAQRQETRRKVLEAVAELPDEDRLVIVLKHMEGLSYKEIAEISGTTVSAVESRLFRARRTLREKLTHTINSDL